MTTTQPASTAPSRNTSALPLAGKVALVTGGSRGIGAAIVERLARDGAATAFTYAGAKDRAEAFAQTVTKAGGRALAIEADNTDADAVKRSVTQTIGSFGRLDILVNNAGIIRFGRLLDLSPEDFDKMIAVNVRGAFMATQEAARQMKDGGRIINIGSVNSDVVPFDGISLYALTKGAIAGLTKGLVHELSARGITINNIQPGPVDTEANPANGPNAKMMTGLVAMHRFAHTSEIAGLVAYLAGPDGGFVTGAQLRIDGGFGS